MEKVPPPRPLSSKTFMDGWGGGFGGGGCGCALRLMVGWRGRFLRGRDGGVRFFWGEGRSPSPLAPPVGALSWWAGWGDAEAVVGVILGEGRMSLPLAPVGEALMGGRRWMLRRRLCRARGRRGRLGENKKPPRGRRGWLCPYKSAKPMMRMREIAIRMM